MDVVLTAPPLNDDDAEILVLPPPPHTEIAAHNSGSPTKRPRKSQPGLRRKRPRLPTAEHQLHITSDIPTLFEGGSLSEATANDDDSLAPPGAPMPAPTGMEASNSPAYEPSTMPPTNHVADMTQAAPLSNPSHYMLYSEGVLAGTCGFYQIAHDTFVAQGWDTKLGVGTVGNNLIRRLLLLNVLSVSRICGTMSGALRLGMPWRSHAVVPTKPESASITSFLRKGEMN